MNILITGGTGSLGQTLVERLLPMPTFKRICIYSRDEHKQDNMRKRLKDHPKLRFFIGDIRDLSRLTLAMRNIQLVVHAAALKIVPTAEYNPFETIKTNVLGAQNVVQAALDTTWHNGVCFPRVLAVSTDKAVHPINLYGASKLCAEKIFIAANNISGNAGPRFSVARYGNVSNSNGSVIPLFREQVSRGENLTITHPDMTRFWITLDEAIELVMYGLNKMHGGEIFVPMMPSYNVKDLAMIMMEKYKLEDQWTRIIGIRPGEKLHETIMTKEELEIAEVVASEKMYIINSPGLKLKEQEAIQSKWEDYTSDNAYAVLSQEQLRAKLATL